MLVCSCNIVTREEIVATITDLLTQDAWRFISPVQVYHEMGKRGRCCRCFPDLVDLIVNTTEAFHREASNDETKVLKFITKLKKHHQQCETARMLAAHRLKKVNAA